MRHQLENQDDNHSQEHCHSWRRYTYIQATTEIHVTNVCTGGQVGTFITEELLKTGKHKVTAITRAGSENAIPKGCHSAVISYDDHASIVAALKGQDCLVISLAVTAPPDTSDRLFKAAADAKVPWVLPNEWGGDTSDDKYSQIFLGRNDQREIIEDLGMSWIGIACSFWYVHLLPAQSQIHFVPSLVEIVHY